jgi:hypothetical protein
MHRNRRRSSSGTSGLRAQSSTRSLNARMLWSLSRKGTEATATVGNAAVAGADMEGAGGV